LVYIYSGNDTFNLVAEITINSKKIPINIPISGQGNGFIDEYGGVPWTIF